MKRRSSKPLDIVLFKRKRTGYLLLAAIAIVAVAVVVAVKNVDRPSAAGPSTTTPPARSTEALTPLVSSHLLAGIAAIPMTTYAAGLTLPAGLVPLERISSNGATASLKSGGKPLVVANLGEFSPLCAIDRWALLEALSQFGTFSGVREMSSSSKELPRDIATFTFRTVTYSSAYLVFRPFEKLDRQGDLLQVASGAIGRVFSRYDNKPYVKAAGGLPFVDFGGEYLQPGTFFWLDATDLKGLSSSKILSQMRTKKSGGELINIQAAYFIAAICAIDGGHPGNVCTSSGIPAFEAQLRQKLLTK